MPSSVNLIDMPDIAMDKILEHCTFPSIQNLFNTCHILRNYITETKPLHITDISIMAEPDHISIEIKSDKEGNSYTTDYRTMNGGCSKEENRKELVENEDIIPVFVRNFGCYLKQFKNTVDNIILEFKDPTHQFHPLTVDQIKLFQNDLLNELENVFVFLRVIDLTLIMTNSKNFLTILKYVDPKALKSLTLANTFYRNNNELLDLTEIMKLEHWKNLNKVVINNFSISEPLNKFDHISIVGLDEKASEQKIEEIKQYLFSLPPERSIRLRLTGLNQVSKVFGAAFETDRKSIHLRKFCFFFQTEKHMDKVLVIDYDRSIGSNWFKSKLIDTSELPDGAVIQKY